MAEDCKAKTPGEPTFTLVGRDRCAPDTIRAWALLAAKAGAPPAKIGKALADAEEFEAWQQAHGSKIPD